MMWEKVNFIEAELEKVAEEIRNTKDRMRLLELGIIRAWLKVKEVEVMDELDADLQEMEDDLN